MQKFQMKQVERMMPDNPYHNKSHVIDVVQCVGYMLKNFVSVAEGSEPSSICFSEDESKLGMKLRPLDIFIIVISSVIHDLGHPGYSNSFLLQRSGWFEATKAKQVGERERERERERETT